MVVQNKLISLLVFLELLIYLKKIMILSVWFRLNCRDNNVIIWFQYIVDELILEVDILLMKLDY